MQYEVYLDVLFLENMMMDFLILLAVKKVFPCSATYGSLLAGSFTGSLLTCAILFFPCPVWTRYILLFFLVNSCMTVIRLKIRTFPVFFKAWILLYLASFGKAIGRLSNRERVIVQMRFGLGTPDGEERTQKEVADLLGISQSYISRLEKKIMQRLRREMVRYEQ